MSSNFIVTKEDYLEHLPGKSFDYKGTIYHCISIKQLKSQRISVTTDRGILAIYPSDLFNFNDIKPSSKFVPVKPEKVKIGNYTLEEDVMIFLNRNHWKDLANRLGREVKTIYARKAKLKNQGFNVQEAQNKLALVKTEASPNELPEVDDDTFILILEKEKEKLLIRLNTVETLLKDLKGLS